MFSRPLSRRVFLKASGGALVGTLAFASGPIALLAPSRSWAVTTEQLTTHEGEVLLRFTRHVFPHPNLEDAVYALVVKDLDRQADADPTILKLLREGVTALDRQAGGDWLALDAAQQQARVAESAGSPFFEKVTSPPPSVVMVTSPPLSSIALAMFSGVRCPGSMCSRRSPTSTGRCSSCRRTLPRSPRASKALSLGASRV